MFFDRFREALVRLPAGLIRTGPMADTAALTATETALGTKLPEMFVSFLGSFDGADLFHEAVILAGVGATAFLRLQDLNPASEASAGELVFAETSAGDRYLFDAAGRIVRIRPGSDERWIAGTDFSRWLDGLVAHERVLYGADGEFLPDVFEADGVEVLPLAALKQAERALRHCPESADWQHERGRALRRLGRLADARAAFAGAAAADPDNPWPRFDLGRAALATGPAAAREAGDAFEAAARLDRGEGSGRIWVWAARAALLAVDPARLLVCRQQALARDPGLEASLQSAREQALRDGDEDEIAEAEALWEALQGPVPSGRMRLPVVIGRAAGGAGTRPPAPVSDAPTKPARRKQPPPPRRHTRATQRRSGASPAGRRR